MIWFLIFFFSIPSISSTYYFPSLPTILINPLDYPKSDLIVHDFRYQFHPIYPYRCLLQTESKYFYINPSCQLLTRTSLKQICSFNITLKFEIVLPQNTTIYQLTIKSNQSNCPAHQLCQFEKNPYRIKLKENQIYKHFLHIKTLPSCSSSNYLLSSTNSKKNFDYFSLNSSTGYLSLLQPLDYESITTWKLVLQAHDIHHIPFYTYVIIDVDDINDCPPLLSWNFPLQTIEILNDTDPFNIEISIDESKVEQRNIIIANLIVSDLDSPLKFDLKIDSSDYLPFTIAGPYGDSTYVLLTNEKLDREEQNQYILNLILHDSSTPRLTSYYKLILHLEDNNDNAPKFDKDIYYVDIQENNFLNTTLLQIFANDSDLGENGHVTYELNNEKRNYIWLDQQTGIIRTNIQFDYEEMTNFSFNVTAMDHPHHGQQLKTTAMVLVNIIDQNDNIPKFPQSIYEFSIYENNAPHSYIGQVTAFDADSPSLTYTLDNPTDEISSLFSLSPSDGKIYAHKSLDREQSDHYIFHLIAFDGYHTSSRIKIRIKILDLNDEIPRFLFPNDNNDTLILDRRYWNRNNYICQIEIYDNDQISTHTLLLIYYFDQLKNYDYLLKHPKLFQFDSQKFFLDQQGKLFFNDTILNEGVYYLAFKIIDGDDYYDEKLLKLIIVNNYEHVQAIVQQYDYLGLHLNNRFAYLQYQNSKKSRQSSSLDQSNKYLLFIIFSILTIILIGITILFVSLIRWKTIKQKELLKKQNLLSTNNHPNQANLHVSNCCDYNDSTLLMLNKDLINSTAIMNDNCCLLETRNEKDIYDQQKKKAYSSWVLSTSNRPESRHTDSSTFHSFNRLSIPSSSSNLTNELCSPKRHSNTQIPADYSVAIVSSSTNNSSDTPVSSDDGFCGSSDISDPSMPGGHHHHPHLLTSYRPPYLTMKDSMLNKTPHIPSFTNGTDTTRRVRFNLISKQQQQQQQPPPILSNHLSARSLRQVEQMYITRKKSLEEHSTVV